MTDNVTVLRSTLITRFEAEVARIGTSFNRVGKQLGYSGAALSSWRSGSYRGNNDAIDRAVRQWLDTSSELDSARLDGARLDRHVELQVTGEIAAALTAAQAMSDLVLIKCPSGTGKTWTCQRYAARRTGAYLYTARPDTRSMSGMLIEIISAISAIGDRSSAMKAAMTVISALRDRSALLMIDEAHHLRPALLEELRCIRDAAGCGLALIGDETIETSAASLPQLVGRIGERYERGELPDTDIELLVSSFLERPAGRREVALAAAQVRGPGGLHALRRLFKLALARAQVEGRDMVTADDLAAVCEAPAHQPDAPAAKEARA